MDTKCRMVIDVQIDGLARMPSCRRRSIIEVEGFLPIPGPSPLLQLQRVRDGMHPRTIDLAISVFSSRLMNEMDRCGLLASSRGGDGDAHLATSEVPFGISYRHEDYFSRCFVALVKVRIE